MSVSEVGREEGQGMTDGMDVADAAEQSRSEASPEARTGPGSVSRSRHAVVIGGGLAGLLSAHVLADHAQQVTLIERDRFPDRGRASEQEQEQGQEQERAEERDGEPAGERAAGQAWAQDRPGVPQGRHPHILLESGQQAIESLLPGFIAQLAAAGSPRVGLPADMVQWQERWFARLPATQSIFTGSRAQLEQLVRDRVCANPAIRLVDATDVVGLTGDAERVRGVQLRARGHGTRRELAADLVVDASGRGSHADRWLTGIGAEPPRVERLDTGLAYASRLYRDTRGELTRDGAPAGQEGGRRTDALAYYVFPSPTHPNGGGILPVEGGRHLAILFGLRGDEPPTDEEEFTRYAATRLPHPFIHDWLTHAEPLSPIHGFRNTANVRRRYDRPGRRPAGFLAVGDALCTFNPIYGQGMAVAAMTAVALRDALADPRRTPTTLRVQRALLDASRQAWEISAGADKTMPGAVGDSVMARTPLVQRPANWYLRRVQAYYATEPAAAAAFRSVLDLSSPFTALFTPKVARAVLLRPAPPAPTEPPLHRSSPSDAQ
ncbi:FAD-binding monooxygenase [Streptomyces olivaceiscleroticus]|uniref:FAD-binding monooxygenase n=1 Tax=Streptomyces olivaceiscleroticus TaxID=68245 RepID=A0ABN0ZJT1_9ACTN